MTTSLLSLLGFRDTIHIASSDENTYCLCVYHVVVIFGQMYWQMSISTNLLATLYENNKYKFK